MTFSEDFLSIVATRHCKRAFLPTHIDGQILSAVFEAALQTASSKNTQPWQIAVISGAARDQLSAQLCEKFDAGVFESPDFKDHPDPMPEVHMARARDCGHALFELKGIGRDDREKRKAHSRENFTFFGAPVQIIFHLPAHSQAGNFLDMGAFTQSVQLGLWAHGIGSCPQASLTAYAPTIRQFLKLEDRWIVCGLACGYPDPDAVVNTFIPQRVPLDEVVSWIK